jgi:putative ABC transport system permease protein
MKSYLKFLSRNKLYTAIEAVGLIVSLAFVILIGTSIRDQLGIVNSVPDHESLYLVGPEGLGGEYRTKETLASIPQIELTAAFRIYHSSLTIGEDNRFVEIGLMDPELLQMIPLSVLSGGSDPFAGGEGVVITASAARRLFPDEDPLGQTVRYLRDPDDMPVPATITGVLDDPSYTILGDFDFAVSLQSRLCPLATEVRESDMQRNGYGRTVDLFSRLHPGVQVDSILNDRVGDPFRIRFTRYEPGTPMLIPYDNVYLSDQSIYSLRQGKKVYLSVLVALVVLLLLSALLSYINLSLAVTGDRAKEMATRRLVGEDRGGVFRQVLGESLIFVLACYALAIVLAWAVAPGLDSIRPTGLNVPFRLRLDGGFWLLSAGLVLLVGLLAGMAPAAACASFRPLDVVSGKIRRKRKMYFGYVCIVLQGVLAVVLIVMAITLERQLRFLEKADLGADLQEDLFFFHSPIFNQGDDLLPLAEQIKASPFVEELGFTTGYPTYVTLTTAGKHVDLGNIECDETAFNMLGFRVEERFAQLEGSVMLSRTAANFFGITQENATPADIYWGYEENSAYYPSAVGGIVGDFRIVPVNGSPSEKVPVVEITPAGIPPGFVAAFLIRTGKDHLAFEDWFRPMVNAYHKEATGFPDVFDMEDAHSGYIEDLIAADHDDMRRYVRLVEIFCLISILLSLLALLAMSSHYAGANAKGIAVRKVFGGTVGSETLRSVWVYMLWIGISLLIAIPIAILVSERFLQHYPEHITGTWWIFVVSALLSVLLSLASVLWQTLKAAKTNPAIELKKE